MNKLHDYIEYRKVLLDLFFQIKIRNNYAFYSADKMVI